MEAGNRPGSSLTLLVKDVAEDVLLVKDPLKNAFLALTEQNASKKKGLSVQAVLTAKDGILELTLDQYEGLSGR